MITTRTLPLKLKMKKRQAKRRTLSKIRMLRNQKAVTDCSTAENIMLRITPQAT